MIEANDRIKAGHARLWKESSLLSGRRFQAPAWTHAREQCALYDGCAVCEETVRQDDRPLRAAAL